MYKIVDCKQSMSCNNTLHIEDLLPLFCTTLDVDVPVKPR